MKKIAIFVILIFIILISGCGQNSAKKLTSDNFKILSASWNDKPGTWDWKTFCDNWKQGGGSETAGAYLNVQASENLICHQKINGKDIGENKLNNGKLSSRGGAGVNEGLTKVNVYDNVDSSKNNEIIMCCVSADSSKEGMICNSVILSLKCN